MSPDFTASMNYFAIWIGIWAPPVAPTYWFGLGLTLGQNGVYLWICGKGLFGCSSFWFKTVEKGCWLEDDECWIESEFRSLSISF